MAAALDVAGQWVETTTVGSRLFPEGKGTGMLGPQGRELNPL